MEQIKKERSKSFQENKPTNNLLNDRNFTSPSKERVSRSNRRQDSISPEKNLLMGLNKN